MAAITAKMVSDLRAKTGCGMMENKKALTEANGDFDEAVKVLRERGLAVANKKASRIASEGVVDIMTNDAGNVAAMIEVNAETDFVAKNDTFKEFVRGILSTIIEKRPADMATLLALPYLDTDFTVEGKLKDMIFTIGENMNIRRFVIVDGILSTYIHGKGTTGVIISFDADDTAKNNPGFPEFAKNIALQVAAMPVSYLNKESVPQSVLDEELGIIMTQIKNDPKNASKPRTSSRRWRPEDSASSMKRAVSPSRATSRTTLSPSVSTLRRPQKNSAERSLCPASGAMREAKDSRREKTTLPKRSQDLPEKPNNQKKTFSHPGELSSGCFL